jgi:probable phosphoglycerate mutase
MTLLAVLRHGPTAWNAAKLNQGRSDVPLSPEGRAAVKSWTETGPWRALPVYTSPLRRARETALLVFGRATIEARLIEMSWGDWEGRSLDDLRRELGPSMKANEDRGLDFRPTGGESPREVAERLEPWLAEIAARRQDCVAVTHRGVMRVLLALAFDWPMLGRPPVEIGPATIHEFRLAPDGRPHPVRFNVSLVPP